MMEALRERSYITRRHTKSISVSGSNIFLNFGEGTYLGKRSSFLPPEFAGELRYSGAQVRKEIPKTPVTAGYGASFGSFEANSDIRKFCTGSRYVGQWNKLGIAGKGIYKFPHGVIYDGYFNRNGEFHGSGILIYPNGQRLEGHWKNGKMATHGIQLSKGNHYYSKEYCKVPDRRFQIELDTELQPATQENLTNSYIETKIPEGCYDTGRGFYDPKIRAIRKSEDPAIMTPIGEEIDVRIKQYQDLLIRSPSEWLILENLTRWKISQHDFNSVERGQIEWIEKNCRYAGSIIMGFHPELYERWTSGAKKYGDFEIFRLRGDDQDRRTTTISAEMGALFLDPDSVKNSSRRTTISSVQALSTMFLPFLKPQKPKKTRIRLDNFPVSDRRQCKHPKKFKGTM